MPSSRNLNDDEDPLMQETLEKTPGVYVRTGEAPPTELDLLWSGTRGFMKEDRSPFFFFLGGFLLGVLLTAAVMLLLFQKPQAQAGDSPLTTPEVEINALSKDAEIPVSEQSTREADLPRRKASAKASGSAQSYRVVSGDTLERIARQFYGNGSPEMVEKIRRANNLENPDSLKLDQELVIPPQAY